MCACKPLPYGQLTTALVPTVPSPCFPRQSATITKVRETSLCLICLYPLRDQLVVVGSRWLGRPWLGAAWFESYMLRSVSLDSSLQSPGQEKHFGILFIPLRIVVREIVVCRDIVEEIMADQSWFSALLMFFYSSPGILRQPPLLARERETFWYLFCPCMPYGFRVSLKLVGIELLQSGNDYLIVSC